MILKLLNPSGLLVMSNFLKLLYNCYILRSFTIPLHVRTSYFDSASCKVALLKCTAAAVTFYKSCKLKLTVTMITFLRGAL